MKNDEFALTMNMNNMTLDQLVRLLNYFIGNPRVTTTVSGDDDAMEYNFYYDMPKDRGDEGKIVEIESVNFTVGSRSL